MESSPLKKKKKKEWFNDEKTSSRSHTTKHNYKRFACIHLKEELNRNFVINQGEPGPVGDVGPAGLVGIQVSLYPYNI